MMIKELKAICQKGDLEPFWISKYLIRPLSIYFTYIFIKLKLTANDTSILSLFFAIASSLILCLNTPNKYLYSSILLFIFLLLDHVDGELARYYIHLKRGKQAEVRDISGAFLDRIVHYFQGISFYACLGYSLSMDSNSNIWFLLGILSALSSAGLPRYVAIFDMIQGLGNKPKANILEYIIKNSKFNIIHFDEERTFYTKAKIPQTITEFKSFLRQLFGFPANIVTYFFAVTFSSIGDFSLLSIKAILLIYTIVLVPNTIYSLKKYKTILTQMPL